MTALGTAPVGAPTGAWAAGGHPPSLVPAVRPALVGPAGRVALRLGPLGPRRRRAARLLLREAARADGGAPRVLEAAAGHLLLLGATPRAADRAAEDLARHGLLPADPAAAVARWRIPEDAAALLAWAEVTEPAAPAAAAVPDAALAALPLARVVRRRSVLRLGPGVAPGRAAWRLAVSRAALAAALGPPAAVDPDRLEEAADRLVRRLIAAPPAAWPPPPGGVGGLLLLPLPLRGDPGPAPAPGAVGVLPLAAAAEPAALDARRARLAAAGWGGLALDGLDAEALALVEPAALPREGPLLLRWSPALADRRAALAALRALDPARLVLTGCDDATGALGWGLARGIRHFAGPGMEALLDAAGAGGAAP